MESQKAIEILKNAILMEVKGQAFYKNVADQSDNEDVRNIFNIMAEEEKMHTEFLSKQYSFVKNNGTAAKVDLPHESQDNISQLILSPDIKNKLSGAGFEAAAISASIDMENKAVEIYIQFSNETSDPNIRELFLWLADWEKGHVKILSQLDNELKEKVWFDNNFWPF